MKDLNRSESMEINGGSLGMDVGWFIGQIISGHFASAHGIVEALVDYQILYSKK